MAESRQQIGILFGFLTLAFAAALIRGATGAQNTAGRVASVVVCGSASGWSFDDNVSKIR